MRSVAKLSDSHFSTSSNEKNASGYSRNNRDEMKFFSESRCLNNGILYIVQGNDTSGRDTISARTERSTRRASAVSLRLRLRPAASLRFRNGAIASRSSVLLPLRRCPCVFHHASVLCYSTFPPLCDDVRRTSALLDTFCRWLFPVLANVTFFATLLGGESVFFLLSSVPCVNSLT